MKKSFGQRGEEKTKLFLNRYECFGWWALCPKNDVQKSFAQLACKLGDFCLIHDYNEVKGAVVILEEIS